MLFVGLMMGLCFAPLPREPLADDRNAGFVGISFDEVGNGIRVDNVYAKSPAEDAGLVTGDIITRFGPLSLRDTPTFQRFIYNCPPNTLVNMEVERDGKPTKLKLRIGHRPADFPHSPPRNDDEPPQP